MKMNSSDALKMIIDQVKMTRVEIGDKKGHFISSRQVEMLEQMILSGSPSNLEVRNTSKKEEAIADLIAKLESLGVQHSDAVLDLKLETSKPARVKKNEEANKIAAEMARVKKILSTMKSDD